MAATTHLEISQDAVWHERNQYDEAELDYQQFLVKGTCSGKRGGCKTSTSECSSGKSSLVCEIAKAREHIQKSLNNEEKSTNVDHPKGRSDSALEARVAVLETEQKQLKQVIATLEAAVKRLEGQVQGHSTNSSASVPRPCAAAAASPCTAKNANSSDVDEDEDDFELFGDEEDDEEAERVKQERVKAYEERKAKKPVLIAKSNIILDVKPWDDETDMAELEKCVRSIEMDGLLWGSSKLVPLAYTIKKLQISCVVEDDKVSTEDLEEKILAFEDYIQSVDIAAFNKI